MKGHFAVLLSLCLVGPIAHGSEASDEEAINAIASCAGLWDFWSDYQATQGTPATAERLRHLGNGAESSAQWLLAVGDAEKTGVPTRYGSWSGLTKPKREDTKLRLKGLVELGDVDQVKRETDLCTEILPTQEGILKLIRKQMVEEQQAAERG